ncbi:hypothetical protein [Paraburkholderia phytofirmans]|uniref:hypothetical protein n=1 Tax=Paraburkholderia TaxID=1822464 RepID=UPI0011DF58A3|nr:hypothetical protein [Paraburkholderia phytofirmans]
MAGHGFRATGRALIRERLGYAKEIVERHLAHGRDEELGDAYDRAQFPEIAQSITHSLEYGGAIQTLSRSCIEQYDETGNHHAEIIKKISIAHIAR